MALKDGAPVVVMPIFVTVAPAGTVTVTCVSAFTVKSVAIDVPKVIFEVCVRPVPVISTCVPGGPLAGVKPVIVGLT